MSDKPTLQEVLAARQRDPRALRGAIGVRGNRLFITFGEVGENPRFALEVTDNDVSVINDPRGEDAEGGVNVVELTEKLTAAEADVKKLTEENAAMKAAAEKPTAKKGK